MDKQKINVLYKRSLNIDGFIAFITFFFWFLTVSFGLDSILEDFESFTIGSLASIIAAIMSFGYLIFGDIILRKRTIGMRLCNIKIVSNANGFLKESAFLIYRKLIVSSWTPFIGPSFDELCRKSDSNTMSYVSFNK